MNCTNLNVTLQTLVEAHGLEVVVATLAEVCGGKAEHARAHGQDARLAKAWDRNARAVLAHLDGNRQAGAT